MAILKYKLVVGDPSPPYIFDPAGFEHPTKASSDPDTFWRVGIGLGGGTVLTHAELLTFVKEIHALVPFQNVIFNTPPDPPNPPTLTDKTDAEVETMVSDWCIEKGHTNPDGR